MHHHHYQYYHNRYHYSDHQNFPEKRSDDVAAEVHPMELIQRMVTCSAVVVFSRSTCCLSHVIKRLFRGMGVNPAVYELDEFEYPIGKELETALMRLLGTVAAPPVVFVGGRLVGGIDRVLGSHISGTLVPLLKEAGALWL